MEEVGEHRGGGGGADQPLGLEGLHLGRAQPLRLGVQQPSPGASEGIGLQRALERLGLQQHGEAGQGALMDRRRGEAGQRGPEMVLHRRVDCDALAGEEAGDPLRRPGAFLRRLDARQRLQRHRLGHVGGQRAAKVMPVAAHGDRRGADRAAEVEGEDLRARVAAELQRHQRQQHRLARAGRADDQHVPDIAHMQREAEWRRAIRPCMEERRATQMLVPFGSGPDRRDRDDVGEVQRRDRRLPDIGVEMAGTLPSQASTAFTPSRITVKSRD